MNHDLIAAGHPRLLYEFANQQSKHPRHWSLAKDKARNPDYEVRAWALGTVIGTERSLALLEGRARKAEATHEAGPWPELAEHDCFACHRELKPWADGGRPGGRGALPWGEWALPTLGRLARVRGEDALLAEGSPLVRLPALMRQPGVRTADAARLARDGAAELLKMEARLTREPFRLGDVEELIARLLDDPNSVEAANWTGASRDYLALVALVRARGDLGGQPLDDRTASRLSALQSMLDLPTMRASDGPIVDSPASFDPARYRIDLRRLREGVDRRGE